MFVLKHEVERRLKNIKFKHKLDNIFFDLTHYDIQAPPIMYTSKYDTSESIVLLKTSDDSFTNTILSLTMGRKPNEMLLITIFRVLFHHDYKIYYSDVYIPINEANNNGD